MLGSFASADYPIGSGAGSTCFARFPSGRGSIRGFLLLSPRFGSSWNLRVRHVQSLRARAGVALAQEAAPPGNAGTASGIIMSLHYTAGVIAPLIAAH